MHLFRCLIFILMTATGVATLRAQDAEKPATPASPTPPTVPDSESRELKVGDRLGYYINEDPVEGTEPIGVIVTEIGEAHFKVSRGTEKAVTVLVKGRKMSEVREEVVRKLEADYYQKATVSINLYESNNGAPQGNGNRVLLRGEAKATSYNLRDDKKTLLSEVLLEVGYGDYANLKKVKLTRKDPVTGKTETKTINMDAVINDNKTDLDVELKPDDRIEVPAGVFQIRKR